MCLRVPLFANLVFACGSSVFALDSADLLFHLSFDNGITAEFSRGNSQPINTPTELERRLVEGLFGKGYLHAGKGSTIEYAVPVTGARVSQEMYDQKANLFGDQGTVSLWIKPLPNLHNMQHLFFRCEQPVLIDIGRTPWNQWVFNYNSKGGFYYDALVHYDDWLHFVLTWRKNEARGYLNGNLTSTTLDTGVGPSALQTFKIAWEGLTWMDFQKKEFEDDAVMDELQIFRRPLSAQEVRALFERGHVTTKLQAGNIPDSLTTKPAREYAGHAFVAPKLAAPVVVDANLDDWKTVPGQGCLIERRLGVLDDDPTRVYAACDDQNLCFGFRCDVDPSVANDFNHFKYPTGEFLTTLRDRDGDVYSDDYVEFVLKSKDSHVYRFALNAQGSLLDSRDGDKAWNANAQWKGRSDFKDWTIEFVVPLADLGLKIGDIVDFNVSRSWKLFKSSQNNLCADERGLPSLGKLTLGGPVSASVDSVGNVTRGDVVVSGSILGPAGDYVMKIRGKGHGVEFADEQKVSVSGNLTPFTIKRRLDKPADQSLVVTVLNPSGQEILVRTIPFVYVATSTIELANYPGWGKLDVAVTPIGASVSNMQASVALTHGSNEVLQSRIEKFDDPSKSVRFDTKPLATGKYEVVTRLMRDGQFVSEDRQPYEKKPLPEWFNATNGMLSTPPVPWTPVRARGNTVQCLLKTIRFDKSLFPAEIVSNGSILLRSPVRIRVKQNGQERVIAAGKMRFTGRTPRRVSWEATGGDTTLQIKVNGWIEFDGFTWMDATFSGGKVEHLAAEIPLRREAITLKNMDGIGPITNRVASPHASYWFGNEKAGLQYFAQDTRGWVWNGEPYTVTPTNDEIVISMPFIQKPVDLSKPRTVSFGWALTPSKPVRSDWRFIKLYLKGISYSPGDYTFPKPNYPVPMNTKEAYEKMAKELPPKQGPITGWYAFGTCQWVGSPEYAEWWREWRWTPSDLGRPDPNSSAWAPACPSSSSANFYMWMMDNFVKHYPQRAIYYDCKQWIGCNNEAHGCGWLDDNGVRQTENKFLAQRSFYERVYNIHKTADPVYGWVRHHDWSPNMCDGAFMDDNWIGEGMIGPIMATAEKNYYHVVDLPQARYHFVNEHWGHLTAG